MLAQAFVGRDRELARLRDAIERACAGTGALAMLSGEAGAGKTRLALAAEAIAIERGARVVWGPCWETGAAPAFWPWIQVFRALAPDDDPLAPSDAHHGDDTADARFRVLDRAARSLLRSADAGPLVVILDDLHAADLPSLALLQLVVRAARGARLAVIAAYRDAEARASAATGAALAKIARAGEVIDVGRLSVTAVSEWLAQTAPGEDAREVHGVTEGNPLFVTELLRMRASGGRARTPDGIRAVLDEHLARLPGDARAVLEVASVLGRDIALAELVAVSGIDADAVDERLRDGEAAAITVKRADGRHAFAHILLRDQIYASVLPSRRAALHWRAGEVALRAGDRARAAEHLLDGAAAGDPERAVETARAAAAHALARLAFEDAARLAGRALAVLGAARSPVECELRLVLGEALIRAGDGARGKAACVAAAALATELGDAALAARAALIYGTELTSSLVDPVMVRLLRAALDQLAPRDDAMRARVMARLAAALAPPRADTMAEVVRLADASIAMARRLGDAETLLYALQFAISASGYLVTSEVRFALIQELVALAVALDHRATLRNIAPFYAVSLFEHGRRDDADAAVHGYLGLVAEVPFPHYQWRAPMLRSVFAALEGHLEEAEQLCDEAEAIAERGGVLGAALAVAVQRIALACTRGDPASIGPRADRILEVLAPLALPAPYAAWVHAAIGRGEHARTRLRVVLEQPQNFPGLLIAGATAVVLGDRELAIELYARLAVPAFRRRVFWGPAAGLGFGPTERTLGDLAMVLGRHDDAVRHYDDAIAQCDDIGARALGELARRDRASAIAQGAGIAAPVEPARPASSTMQFSIARDGELWTVTSGGASFRLKDSKGLVYLAELTRRPGIETHVAELAGLDQRPGDAGVLLDAAAKRAYRTRLEDLAEELEDARGLGHASREARARAEMEAIADQLAAAVGLGGRDRRAASQVERARINVQRRLRDAIDRIAEHDAALGRWLTATVKTGVFCSWNPI